MGSLSLSLSLSLSVCHSVSLSLCIQLGPNDDASAVGYHPELGWGVEGSQWDVWHRVRVPLASGSGAEGTVLAPQMAVPLGGCGAEPSGAAHGDLPLDIRYEPY